MPKTIEQDEAFSFAGDVLRYLENDKSEEYETNQGILVIQNVLEDASQRYGQVQFQPR